MIKVVTTEEMVRVEKWAIGQGADQKAFMVGAGHAVARAAREWLDHFGGKRVVILVGRGNKGGDGYVAAQELLASGFEVTEIVIEGEVTELNRHFGDLFCGNVRESIDFSDDDLIIDALLGTGFHGPVEGKFKEIIEAANSSTRPILSIDIPSGLNGTTGEVLGVAIQATFTVTLGLPKTGQFLRDGWNHVGDLLIADFGLSENAIQEAKADFLLPDLEALTLPTTIRNQHKYERGFVLGFGGSSALKGSVKLSARAALHAGAGIVKIFSLEEIGPVDDELISDLWDPQKWDEGLKNAQAVFIGPGLGRTEKVKQWLEENLPKIKQPCILDADALYYLNEIQTWPALSILTPHRGEMAHLLGKPVTELLCQKYANEKNCILVLKGAPTFIFSPNTIPLIMTKGNPGMATAGSGDVLTGIITSLAAQGKTPLDAALLGATLHALCGEEAAREKTSNGYTASDLIVYLPKAISRQSGS